MNLRQAYDGWSQQEQNRQLYIKTRDAFRRAWFTLPTNKPCSWYTKDVLALALAETRVVESDKVKAASVMVHVLTWANFAEPKWNPKPDFRMEALTRLIHLPANELEKERQRITAAVQQMPESEEHDDNQNDLDIDPVTALPRQAMAAETDENKDPLEGIDFPDENEEPKKETDMEKEKSKSLPASKPVVRIDPETMLLAGLYESISKAQRETGIKNITRAVQNRTLAGGYYWCLDENKSTFQPAEKKQTGRPSKPKAKKTVVKPSPAVQVAVVDNPTPSVTQQSAADGQPAPAEQQPVNYTLTPEPLSQYSDDELLAELDRRGFEGELSRRVVYTIGEK